MRKKHWTIGLVTLAVISWFLTELNTDSSVQAQSGSHYRQPGSGTRSNTSRPVATTFESKFWNWISRVEYRNWAPGPGKSTDAYPGQSPHGAFVKTYLNRTAAGHPKTLPQGSIIVKENFGKDGKTLMAITVMYRAEGYNPQANDWYWVKYSPDGTVARTPPEKGSKMIAGKFASCIDCHSGAKGNDYSFIND